MKTPEQWLQESEWTRWSTERKLAFIQSIQNDAYDDGVMTMYEQARARLLSQPDTAPAPGVTCS